MTPTPRDRHTTAPRAEEFAILVDAVEDSSTVTNPNDPGFGNPWKDPNGQVLPDIHAMGASSTHMDLFVEVGANDPERYSQTWALEQRGWTGVLVEPLPDLAKKLREQRRAQQWKQNLVLTHSRLLAP